MTTRSKPKYSSYGLPERAITTPFLAAPAHTVHTTSTDKDFLSGSDVSRAVDAQRSSHFEYLQLVRSPRFGSRPHNARRQSDLCQIREGALQSRKDPTHQSSVPSTDGGTYELAVRPDHKIFDAPMCTGTMKSCVFEHVSPLMSRKFEIQSDDGSFLLAWPSFKFKPHVEYRYTCNVELAICAFRNMF
jgi:hypothetical protein